MRTWHRLHGLRTTIALLHWRRRFLGVPSPQPRLRPIQLHRWRTRLYKWVCEGKQSVRASFACAISSVPPCVTVPTLCTAKSTVASSTSSTYTSPTRTIASTSISFLATYAADITSPSSTVSVPGTQSTTAT